jgi:putative addiction module component (TIGR02574 family)
LKEAVVLVIWGMTVKDQVLQLPKEEKLKIMEALWDSLTQDVEDFESPEWHENALKETLSSYEQGREEVVDWEEAKKRLR